MAFRLRRVDFASCSFNQAFIPGLPDDATDRDRACMPRMFIPATIIPPIGRGVTVLTYCALTMAGWKHRSAAQERQPDFHCSGGVDRTGLPRSRVAGTLIGLAPKGSTAACVRTLPPDRFRSARLICNPSSR